MKLYYSKLGKYTIFLSKGRNKNLEKEQTSERFPPINGAPLENNPGFEDRNSKRRAN